jgi:murein DD-endopeptidase MepM/ murein hydrolase activator NlpD
VYSPFFIDEDRIGYGSGGSDHVASLYSLDIRSLQSIRLTNRKAGNQTFDPFPETSPIANAAGDELRFAVFDKGRELNLRLSLQSYDITELPATGEKEHGWPSVNGELRTSPSVPDEAHWPMMESAVTAAASKVYFRLPLKSYRGVYQFYDHAGKDWGCGKKTYSGHRGTDFIANVGDPIVAAAQARFTTATTTVPTPGSSVISAAAPSAITCASSISMGA